MERTVCPIKYVCGGGCRLDSLERHGDIHKPDPTGCFFRRTMFEAALWVLCELGPETLASIICGLHRSRIRRTTHKSSRKRDIKLPALLK